MSEERFDKIFKKQLESVKPAYKEEAWKNFKRLLPVPWYILWWKKYSTWLAGGASGVAVVSAVYIYNQGVTEKNNVSNNKIIAQTNKDLKENGSVNKNGNLIANKDSAVTKSSTTKDKTDTVTIARKTTVDEFGNRKTILAEVPQPTALEKGNETGSGNAGSRISGKIISTPLGTFQTRKTDLTKLSSSKLAKLNRQSALQTNQTSSINVPFGSKTSKTQTDKISKTNSGNSGLVNSNNISGNAPGTILSGLPINGVDSKNKDLQNPGAFTSADSSAKVNNDVILKSKADSLLAAKADTTKSNLVNNHNTSVVPDRKSGINLDPANIHVRAGIVADVLSFKNIAFGPSVEVLLSEKFSFTTGLVLNFPQVRRFAFVQDHNKMAGKRFEDRYRPKLPNRDPKDIKQIEIRTSVLSLPLTFSYFIPLESSNLSFILSGGTNLSLKAYQEVYYNILENNKEKPEKFKATQVPNTFNNLQLGAGVQFEFNRIMGQFTPYFNLQFNRNYFIPKDKFGVKTSFKFDFKKE